MKLWMKILAAVFLLFAVAFASAYTFLSLQGKSLLISTLQKATGRNVSVGSIEIVLPLRLQVRKLQIEGLFKTETLRLTPGLLGLIVGKITVSDLTLIKPEFTYTKNDSPGALFQLPAPFVKDLVVSHLTIQDGKFTFIDRGVGPEGIVLNVEKINVTLSNSYIPPKTILSKFMLEGTIPWQEGSQTGTIFSDGWIDVFKRDMQATLRITDIDGIYLYPYYSNWVDIEKARIEKAKLNFTSTLHGVDNNLTAHCRLELTDIVRKPRSPEEPVERAERIADAVLDIFRAMNEGKVVLDFTVRTKMDRPEFGLGNIKSAVKDTITTARKAKGSESIAVLALPLKVLQGSIKSIGGVSRAMLDGSYAVGKELKTVIEESFKKN